MKYKTTVAMIALIATFASQAFAENGHGSNHGGEGKGINQKKEFSVGSEQVQKKESETMKQMPQMMQMPHMMHGDHGNMNVKAEESKK